MRITRRDLLIRSLPAAALLAACGGDDPVTVHSNGTPLESTPPVTPAATAPEMTPTPVLLAGVAPGAAPCRADRLDPADLCGFAMPIAGACLTASEALMPNAPRTYRRGVHEGVDFYNGLACATVGLGTPVLAMHQGTVVRADLGYRELTPAQLRALRESTNRLGYSDEETLDAYRGRQVWVDHGRGIVSRYAHLSSIADGLRVGMQVRAGQVLGAVGESGTPESIEAPGTELHLHAEVRIESSFLGAGLAPGQVRALYLRLFGLA